MDKEYLEKIKREDPIHYCELMGDPVTGQSTDTDYGFVFFVLGSIISGVAAGISIMYKILS